MTGEAWLLTKEVCILRMDSVNAVISSQAPPRALCTGLHLYNTSS